MTRLLQNRPWLVFWLMRSVYLVSFLTLVVILAFYGTTADTQGGALVRTGALLLPVLGPALLIADYRHVRRHWRRCNSWGVIQGEMQ
ncbi:MAG: hypothetical protein KDJ98_11750 [Rhodobacteraceae bacterium]|nr:hypothetical protein [Paracoccaceae bacterium]